MTQASRLAELGLTAVAVTALAACGNGSGAGVEEAGAGATDCDGATLKIAQAAPTFDYYPFYVAMGSGYLEEVGLNAEVTDLSTGSNIVSAVVTGDVDLGFTTLPATIMAAEEGAPIAAFAWLTGMSTNIVVKSSMVEEKGLTPESTDAEKLEALRGTTMAVTGLGSGSDLVLRYMLKQAGLDPESDLEIIATGGGAKSVSGFTSDRFDGFALSSPQADLGIEQGEGTYLFHITGGEYEPLQDFPYLVAVSSTSTLKGKSDVMGCFAQALAMAQQQIQEDPDAAGEAAQQYMSDLDPELYAQIYPTQTEAMPPNPILTEEAATRANEFLKITAGTEGASSEALTKAINREIAEQATDDLGG